MRRFTSIACALIALSLVLAAAVSADDGVAAAERLARTRFHEGVPAEQAQQIGDAGAARLAEMLLDQGEAQHHAQIAEVLGMSGHPTAWDALRRELDDPPQGEVNRAMLRKRVALRAAMGHLARDDPRARALLVADAGGRRGAPTFSSGRHAGDALDALLRRSSLNALALSGHPSARRALRQLREAADDADFERDAVAALAEIDRVQRRRAARASELPRGSSR